MKKAILQVADTGPLESLVVMLRCAGYQCFVPNDDLLREILACGCDTVLSIDGLVSSRIYEEPTVDGQAIPRVGPGDMATADLYVDVKAQRNGPKVLARWPELAGKVLWYRINGGEPCVTPHGGDEINPGCPILTPNKWYDGRPDAYWCWPPFVKAREYLRPRSVGNWGPPLSLICNARAWCYEHVIDQLLREVKFYGSHGSPDGILAHTALPQVLSHALAFVHPKAQDCPGYALYEAISAACPVVVSRTMVWRMRTEDLFEDGETCLMFDIASHDEIVGPRADECVREIREHLKRLHDPAENKRIGDAGRERLAEIMWTVEEGDYSFRSWMQRMFP